jgi:hypothetical protein
MSAASGTAPLNTALAVIQELRSGHRVPRAARGRTRPCAQSARAVHARDSAQRAASAQPYGVRELQSRRRRLPGATPGSPSTAPARIRDRLLGRRLHRGWREMARSHRGRVGASPGGGAPGLRRLPGIGFRRAERAASALGCRRGARHEHPPVILKPCRFLRDPRLSVFQSVNDPLRPLLGLSVVEQEEVYAKVADRIENELRGGH